MELGGILFADSNHTFPSCSQGRCMMRPVLILGIGNILLRDEGVGVRVVEALQQMQLADCVEVVDGGTAGADLVDVLADRDKVVVIDAIESQSPPGTVFRLRSEELMPSPGSTLSLHQLGLVESLMMAQQLGCAPRQVVVFGIQPDQVIPGLDLTPEVANAIPRVVDAVLEEIVS